MQLCDTGREIMWSISSKLGPDLGPDRSDNCLRALLDSGAARLIVTFPKGNDIALPRLQEPIEQESIASAARKSKGFWPVVVVSFVGICSAVTLLLARLLQ